MSLRAPLFSFFAVIFCLSSLASADVILEYVPTESKTTPDITASNVNSAVTADDMIAGGGISAYGAGVWRWRNWDSTNASFADAVADDEVWTWGYDITEDVQVKLTNLEFRVDKNANTAPDDFEIRMTINGGSEVTVFSHDFAGSNAPATFDVDLTPFAEFQKLGDSIEFTFAGFNSTSNNGTLTLLPFGSGAGLRLEGTVSIPEPGTLGILAGVAGFAFIGRRRMKRKQKAEAEQAA